ncbi:MAG: hypothetical protein Q9219_003603 [cf. Caloplaca sp. 3 TL-2023]
MSDLPGSKKGSIPDWQQHPDHHSTPTEASTPPDPPPSRAALLEQASKFLIEDDIKNAPTEKKIAFLETKGLTREETGRLLNIPSENVATKAQEKTEMEQSSATSPAETSQLKTDTARSQAPSSTPPSRDVPIITYPEFLIHSRKPPPLITASRLINTFYLFSTTAAAIYGTSKYIVDPMLGSLTSARHSLFDTAQTNIDILNDKLEKNVSKVPKGDNEQEREVEEVNSDDADSDTTEDLAPLFNRTVGTQTSSPPSTPSTSDPTLTTPPPQNAISTHEHSLNALYSSLSSLLEPTSTKSTHQPSLKNISSQIADLKRYLESLASSRHHYPSSTSTSTIAKDDAVNKFKADIRGVKGVLLSARNFPSGMTGRAAVG